MRKIREALRLRAGGLSTRKIAASLGVGQTTANEYLKRADQAGLSWPLSKGVTDSDLERLLFHAPGGETRSGLAQPDWPVIHRELRRKPLRGTPPEWNTLLAHGGANAQFHGDVVENDVRLSFA